jgi:type VII secretion protein EccB
MPAQQQNRKDILQAYRLMTDRMALALIAGEPDSPNQPLRRRTTAGMSGLIVGVIAALGFVVWGMLSPGAVKGLTAGSTLTIDKDTATPYVPCKFDGKQELCPALNYASALLALNTASPSRVEVAQASLAQYTIGPTIGIAGLPQDLPTSADLVHGQWSVCSQDNTSTLVGGQSVGGTPLSSAQVALVTVPENGQTTFWLLWNGLRLRIYQAATNALYGQVTPTPVSATMLDAIPQGPDFVAPFIPGSRTPVANGPDGQSALVGQAYEAPGGRFFVLEQGGKLASVSETQAQLLNLETGMRSGSGDQVAPAIPAAVTQESSRTLEKPGLPSAVPAAASLTAGSPVCVAYGADLARGITTGGAVPASVPAGGGGGTVDQVSLPAGHGALVGVSTSATGQTSPMAWFLLDGATRYGMTSSSVPAVLGYTLARDQTVLPASVADLIPQGAVLDPGAATQRTAG